MFEIPLINGNLCYVGVYASYKLDDLGGGGLLFAPPPPPPPLFSYGLRLS